MKYKNYIKRYKFIILFITFFIVIIFYIFLNLFKEEEKEDILYTDVISEQIEEDISNIKVDIKGAVKNPGVYELKSGSRVSDAIEISGGLIEEADTGIINLSKLLTDEMVVIIYTKKEIAEMKKGTTTVKYIEKECICPKLENDACIENVTSNALETNVDNELKDESNNKVSLNTATISELMTLSGIGESKAKAIIEYRDKNNGFKSIEEIKNVSGIGNSTYEKIKDNITI